MMWHRMVHGVMVYRVMPAVMYHLAVMHRMMYLCVCKTGEADK